MNHLLDCSLPAAIPRFAICECPYCLQPDFQTIATIPIITEAGDAETGPRVSFQTSQNPAIKPHCFPSFLGFYRPLTDALKVFVKKLSPLNGTLLLRNMESFNGKTE